MSIENDYHKFIKGAKIVHEYDEPDRIKNTILIDRPPDERESVELYFEKMNNRQFMLEAVKNTIQGKAFVYASDDLKTNREFIKEAVRDSPNSIKYVSGIKPADGPITQDETFKTNLKEKSIRIKDLRKKLHEETCEQTNGNTDTIKQLIDQISEVEKEYNALGGKSRRRRRNNKSKKSRRNNKKSKKSRRNNKKSKKRKSRRRRR